MCNISQNIARFHKSVISLDFSNIARFHKAFSQVSNTACAIYCKILLDIAVGYRRIECTTSGMMLKPIYSMAFIIFTRDVGFIYYSKMFNAI